MNYSDFKRPLVSFAVVFVISTAAFFVVPGSPVKAPGIDSSAPILTGALPEEGGVYSDVSSALIDEDGSSGDVQYHYTAEQLQRLYAFMEEHEGGKADDQELLGKYSCNQCRGFVVKILDECYGIEDNTCFDDNAKYQIRSKHYQQLDQIVYQGEKIPGQRFKEMFALSGVGDVIQMKTRLQWHSAVVADVTEEGVVFFHANYNPKNDIRHDGSAKVYNLISRNLLLWEDFERDYNTSGSGITLYRMLTAGQLE